MTAGKVQLFVSNN